MIITEPPFLTRSGVYGALIASAVITIIWKLGNIQNYLKQLATKKGLFLDLLNIEFLGKEHIEALKESNTYDRVHNPSGGI